MPKFTDKQKKYAHCIYQSSSSMILYVLCFSTSNMAVLLVFAKKVLISLALLFFLNFLFPTFTTVDCFLVDPPAVSPYCPLSLSVLLYKKDSSVAGSMNYRCTTFEYITSARLPNFFEIMESSHSWMKFKKLDKHLEDAITDSLSLSHEFSNMSSWIFYCFSRKFEYLF